MTLHSTHSTPVESLRKMSQDKDELSLVDGDTSQALLIGFLHSSILAWRIPLDRGALWAKVHGVTKSWTKLSV